MKILGLSFANLNSLEGRWEIDFTRPEYRSDGIFAITGPTGSGKSTILDALCLALYGQTPRLGKITKGGNEIMSRHAGECFAEATFSTLSGTYRCHWSQHRARRKAGGELQAQKHELSDAATGKLLQSKLQETLAAVERITGMDFDRFTRSMLLAQGGFAAFLQADADRRAPVLEQITGTEVYSRISMRVHERMRAEQARLELLRADADSVRLLDAGAVVEQEMRLASLLDAERREGVEYDGVSASLRRLETIAGLEAEIAAIDHDALALKAEADAFAPKAARLRRAQAAAALDTVFLPLAHQRSELGRERSELAAREALRPGLAAAVERDAALHEAARDSLRSALEAEALAGPLLARVAEIDLFVTEKKRACGSLRQELEGADQILRSLEEERSGGESDYDRSRSELLDLERKLAANPADADLANALSGMRHAFEELKAASLRQSTAARQLAAGREAMDSCRVAREAGEQAAAAAGVANDEARSRVDGLKSGLAGLLDGRSMKTIRAGLDAAMERRRLLEEIAALYDAGKALVPKIDAVTDQIRATADRRADAGERLCLARQLMEQAEREVALLEENLRLAARVKSFEEERRRLADGEPCPLCGSTNHPFRTGGTALLPDDDRILAEARHAVQGHAASVRELEIAIAGFDTAIEQQRLRQAELASDRERLGRRCLALLGEAGITAPPREAEPTVAAELEHLLGSESALSATVEQAVALDERIREAEGASQATLLASQEAGRRLALADGRLAAAVAELHRLEEADDIATKDFDARLSALLSLLAPFDVGIGPDSDFEAILARLAGRCEARRQDEERSRKLREDAIALEASLKGLADRIAASLRDRDAKKAAATAAGQELERLAADRMELFGERDPARERERLAEAVAVVREGLDRAGELLGRSKRELDVADTAIAGLREGTAARSSSLAAMEAVFIGELAARGFAGEQAFQEARLPESERDSLQQAANDLQRRQQALAISREERSVRLRDERSGMTDGRPYELLGALLRQHEEQLRSIREEVGAVRHLLARNEEAVGEQRLKAAAVGSQAAECRRWDLLHGLIGSADGKKFRNFAQGLTFEIMVAHANRQLALMTDRYQLVRDENEPLELNVVDNWQAGEVRSTRNLSGGESFIVSLALALGLSQMSSRNVRVDSLFLDEGFGTLDEEALETALETLAGLQQSGKLIGIISHVSALKERISTRIRVTPLPGGRSTITGPGVAKR